jgi:hypothetical protein
LFSIPIFFTICLISFTTQKAYSVSRRLFVYISSINPHNMMSGLSYRVSHLQASRLFLSAP